ncbi:hypothetical protein DY000_02021647 [Brassica cretica]|uniref:Uncharacterized protein n=1 Tax=Brassica cretica TaxID=69181 RepID=A0ABQ7EFN3_BRACR|nr:hypothetical protein DY000_02021647 [Brassica cretica]
MDRSPYDHRIGRTTGLHMPTGSYARPVSIWRPFRMLDRSPYADQFRLSTGRHMGTGSRARLLTEHSPYGDRIGRSTGRHMATSLDARFGVAGVNFVVTGFDPNS